MKLAPYRSHREPIEFPSPDGSKTYSPPPVGISDSIRLNLAFEDPASALTDAEFRTMLLGPVWDEMLADNVPDEYAARVLLATAAGFRRGPDELARIWNEGPDVPKAPTTATTSSQPTPTDSTGSPNTAAAPETPTPASTSTTTNSRPASPRSRKAPSTSAGRTSSKSGNS